MRLEHLLSGEGNGVFLRQLGASQLTKRNTSFLESLALLPQFVNKRRKLRNIIMSLEILENLESLDNLEIIESLDNLAVKIYTLMRK